MKTSVLTLFPEYFQGLKDTSIIKRALDKNLFEFETVNYREFSEDKHHHVDDTPYGGGQGMVLMCEPIVKAIRATKKDEGNSRVVLLSPQGTPFTQEKAKEFSQLDHLILICGHYEGYDERIRDYVDEQVSLGDFVMTGGEPAAAAICDATFRLLPGVIKTASFEDDSFENHLLEYPQYTKPYEFEGKKVPEILLSGHHANIARWRREQSLLSTARKRPDLLEKAELSKEDLEFLKNNIETEKEENG